MRPLRGRVFGGIVFYKYLIPSGLGLVGQTRILTDEHGLDGAVSECFRLLIEER